ncbi:MAG: glycoside hydrolase family 5 protein [Cytophagaceae bacterium]
MKKILCFLSLCLLSCEYLSAQTPIDFSHIPKEFIRRNGANLVQGSNDSIVHLHGISFGNQVWTNEALPYTHHNEEDFKRLNAMGMNLIRFYMNYQTFEDDANPYVYKKEGFAWLDKNIAWAKKYGIHLVLNMHVPQGGFQSLGKGEALWENKDNKNRLKALYRTLANRYVNEPTILGFDLVNEPVTTKSIDQWKELAQQLTDEIRKVDRNHLIIVERLNGIAGRWDNDADYNMFLINDENTLYTFHFYSPIEYTHQNASWTSFGEGGKYPDPNRVQWPSDVTWYGCDRTNTKLKAGDSDWKFYEGKKVKVADPKIICGKPCLVSANNHGKAYYDDLIVKEYDEQGNFVREIFNINITTKQGYWYWSHNESGRCDLSMDEGHEDKLSIVLSESTDDANTSSNDYRFRVRQGYSYSVSGWMKGEDINPESVCMIRLDFETSPSKGKTTGRDKEYLEEELKKYLAFGEKNNVPLYCGEFGVINNCFQGKGGLQWVNDMLDLFEKYNVHYTYHSYHEDAFGLYYGYNTLPDPGNGNEALIKLFKTKLKSH